MTFRPGFRCAALCCGLFLAGMARAQVEPDGGTATSVTKDPVSGAANVSIAPPPNTAGISHNTYSRFSVAPAGVNLDNRSVNARTILNEVTSSRISNLNGPLEVLGARAHVILANPNGISVDGASFKNTGGVVLSTGRPSIVTRPTAPGFTQDNVVLDTGGGRIDVGEGGLAGAMTSLQLIAGRIRVDGPVENTSENERADVRLLGGGSRVEYDSAILPISDLEDWGEVTEEGTADDGVAVEITSRGSLKANSVRIRATGRGAGVSHAGSGLASRGDFIIDASGKVTTKGSIKAARDVRISAGSIASSSVPGKEQATIEAVNGALTLLATSGGISNTGVLMQGRSRNAADANSLGGATLRAAGDIDLLTENAEQLAIVFSSADDLVVRANGNVTNDTGRLLSNATAHVSAGGDIANVTDMVAPGETIGEWKRETKRGKRLWYTLWLERERTETISVTYGAPRVQDQQAYIVGLDVDLQAGGDVINRGSSINADIPDEGAPKGAAGGSLTVAAGSSILNEATASGSLRFTKTCRLTCVGYGSSDVSLVGGRLNADGDILLSAGERIDNKGGQLTGLDNSVLSAPEVTVTGLRVPSIHTRPPGLYNFWSGSSAWVGTEDLGGVFTVPEGTLVINAVEPVKVDAGILDAQEDIIIPSGVEIVAPPSRDLPFGKDPIGLFRKLSGN
ncbi:filamentous hemagglutinin N-terminal domain-containing protein [Chelativorans alearense]|uniref:filamentous hemagglutinin N-terminal domain-containing protein n=1 Tax=Chelativorans alearense TaxID=2681495 RepID=UPI001FE3136C|nr:filamentous hemagglutinin N-terminal domain-containing protein [Chelativorans alearense]